ncbi:MAG: fibronectin type III domain-containing protein, partial [Proteobacteria bacterium]|nr:fibronectin type III domain-containing protein [Pseudomonadota bacterium]
LTPGAHKHVPAATDSTEVDRICSSKLGINLEDAKNIQRKLAKILRLKPSSLFLDCISEGSIILTFSLPMCVSLAGLDHNPEIALLTSNGFIILCGPPGKPELEELTSSGMIMEWSPPKYGCDSLVKYQLHYQKKSELEASQWQKLELTSLECRTCLPKLSDGCMYVVKICAVSDVGTTQSEKATLFITAIERQINNDLEKFRKFLNSFSEAKLSQRGDIAETLWSDYYIINNTWTTLSFSMQA